MNADELKLITDAITTLGTHGKDAFVWFLIMKYGLSWLLHLVMWPSGMFLMYKISVIVAGTSSHEQALRAIRKITHPSYSSFVDSSEISAMISEISRLKGLEK